MLSVEKLTKQTLLSGTVCKINSKIDETLFSHAESWGEFEHYLSQDNSASQFCYICLGVVPQYLVLS